MSGSRTLLVSATVVLASWGICGLSYVTVPPEHSGGLFALFVFFAAALTIGAAALGVAHLRGQVSEDAVLSVSGLAAAMILLLAVALQLANH